MDDSAFSQDSPRARSKASVTGRITLQDLQEHFHLPIVEVAKSFKICTTLLKKICRQHGIQRWPHRQIRSIARSIKALEAADATASGGEKQRIKAQIELLESKKQWVIENASAGGRSNQLKRKMTSQEALRAPWSAADVAGAVAGVADDVQLEAASVSPRLTPRQQQFVQRRQEQLRAEEEQRLAREAERKRMAQQAQLARQDSLEQQRRREARAQAQAQAQAAHAQQRYQQQQLLLNSQQQQQAQAQQAPTFTPVFAMAQPVGAVAPAAPPQMQTFPPQPAAPVFAPVSIAPLRPAQAPAAPALSVLEPRIVVNPATAEAMDVALLLNDVAAGAL